MKVLLFILFISAYPAAAQVVFSETFDEADDATTGSDAIGPATWTALCPGSIAATDYFKVVGNKLEARDTNSPGATFTTGDIDVSSCTGLEIALDIEEAGGMEACADCGGTGIICIDWVKLEYNLDGGGWTEVAGLSCVATMTEAPGEMIQIGDIAGGGPITFTSPCIDFGSTLQIRITCMSWAASEYWIFDNITVSCNDCVLPVEIIDFEVSPMETGETRLNWSTLTESENESFHIERSFDGINFEVIGIIDGAGNSTEQIDYRFIDSNPNPTGMVYYRLRQVDFDGKSKFSKTVSLYIPTPASIHYGQNALHFQTETQINKSFLINIYSSNGQLIHRSSIKNSESIPWTNSGFFLIEIPELDYRQKMLIP